MFTILSITLLIPNTLVSIITASSDFFNGECVEKYEYMEQPHEIEAYGAEDKLFVDFMYDTYGEWLGDK